MAHRNPDDTGSTRELALAPDLVTGSASAARPARPARRTLILGGGTIAAAILGGAAPALAAPVLRAGARGPAVLKLQRDLSRLKYWLGTPDGRFGPLTTQAVYALQKAAGLRPDGVVGPKTHAAIARGAQPSRRVTTGTLFEVDKSRQLLLCTKDGRLACILNTSTGSGKRYFSGGRWKRATTPSGDFRM